MEVGFADIKHYFSDAVLLLISLRISYLIAGIIAFRFKHFFFSGAIFESILSDYSELLTSGSVRFFVTTALELHKLADTLRSSTVGSRIVLPSLQT